MVTISRASGTLTFPANPMLIAAPPRYGGAPQSCRPETGQAAMNACPCGCLGNPVKECTCSQMMITRYRKRISGPLMDRIDIHVEVPRVEYDLVFARRTAG